MDHNTKTQALNHFVILWYIGTMKNFTESFFPDRFEIEEFLWVKSSF